MGIAVAVIAAVAGGYAAGRLSTGKTSSAVAPVAPVSGPFSPAATPPIPSEPSIRPLLAGVLPSVVSITAAGPGGRGEGTGIIISSDGEVLTNAHVVAGATTVSVTKYGSTEPVGAKLVGRSVGDDLALLRIDGARNLPAAQLGSSNAVQVGDPVVAVGNALGLAAGTPSVTTGIISAEGRSITDRTGTTMTGLLQTDAAINPGNSGGPLFDRTGTVIGVNTAVAASAGNGMQAQNIGFAIPIDRARALLPVLRSGGPADTRSAELGVTTVTLTDSLRAAYGLTSRPGALVVAVAPGSPAAAVGIRSGDVIAGIDGARVTSSEDLKAAVMTGKVGDRINIDVLRGEQPASVAVQLAAPAKP